jgi:hypothetical protein
MTLIALAKPSLLKGALAVPENQLDQSTRDGYFQWTFIGFSVEH